MCMQRTLLALVAVSMLGGASIALARDDSVVPPAPALPATPLDMLRALKQPIVPATISALRDETIRIELTDASRRTLIIDVGGERPPGTLLEMLRGTPRDGIVLKTSAASAEGTPLEKGGADEKHVLKILQEWREQTGATATVKPGKKKAPPAANEETRLKLMDRAIATLKERNQPPKPAAHPAR